MQMEGRVNLLSAKAFQPQSFFFPCQADLYPQEVDIILFQTRNRMYLTI